MSFGDSLIDALLDSSSDATFLTDRDNRIIRVNSAFERVTGFTSAEVLGKDPRILGSGRHEPSFFAAMWSRLGQANQWRGRIWNRRRNGEVHLCNLSIVAVRTPSGELLNYVATLQDLSGREVATTDGDLKAQHDALTGLPNASLFADRVDQALHAARRADKSVAVLVMGMDRFTRVNEALGHASGDRVLKELATRLRATIRRSDTLARLDGDRFAFVLALASPDDTVLVGGKLLQAAREPCYLDGHPVVLTASIGVSIFPVDGESADELVQHADSAMHHAKETGRNQLQFFANEMNLKAKRRLELEHSLRRALAREEFVLHYQPKVNIETGEIVAAEALVRWNDPARGLVLPGDFIHVAEETGLIGQLGYWILRHACRQNRQWQDLGLKRTRLAVNVSARQFQAGDLVSQVRRVLDETGLDPACLELEITESMLMGDVERAVEKLQRLRDLGVHLSIDDFGTGYSSLSYLSRFPVNTLKIDRSFIRDLDSNHSTAEIARAIIGLSRGLKLEVVAEGAETVEHVRFLLEHGCDVVQGYYYSRPVPAEEFEALLRDGYIDRR